MKNYDKKDGEVKLNYREEEKKKNKSHNLLWLLLLLLFFAVAIITVIIVGVTNSWFAFTQKMEGDFKFESGIVMTYEDIKIQEGSSFYLMKESNYEPLDEINVGWSDPFTIVNPKLSAASGSSDFFLRAKLDYSFTKTGYDAPLNLEELAVALNTEKSSTDYTAENVLSYIFQKVVSFGDNWLYGGDGWFYYVADLDAWTNTLNKVNYEDLQNYVVSEETGSIKLFAETETEKPTYQVVAGDNNHMETFYVNSCNVKITINAFEASLEAFEARNS